MASHSKVYKTYVLYYNYVLIQNKMQIYQRVDSNVLCFLALFSYMLPQFSLKYLRLRSIREKEP